MKTLVNTLFAALALTVFSVTTSLAEPHKPIGRPQRAAAFQSGMYTTVEGKLQIAINKEIGGAVVVSLKNRAGAELFVQEIGKRQAAARLRLDVSNLPDGIYQVIVSNGVEETTQTVTLGSPQPSVVNRVVALQ
ncbi:hypothetical protein GCM10027299_37450 [Larkinella ripae]